MSISSTDSPGRTHLRSRSGLGFNASVAGVQIEAVEAPGGANASIVRVGNERSIDSVNRDRTIAGGKFECALHVFNFKMAVSAVQTNIRGARQANRDFDILGADSEAYVVRSFDIDVNGIS